MIYQKEELSGETNNLFGKINKFRKVLKYSEYDDIIIPDVFEREIFK